MRQKNGKCDKKTRGKQGPSLKRKFRVWNTVALSGLLLVLVNHLFLLHFLFLLMNLSSQKMKKIVISKIFLMLQLL